MVDTKNRGGNTVQKSFTVFTNDPENSEIRLSVTGNIKGFVTIAPAFVRLVGPAGRAISRSVQILPTQGHPFSIKEVKARSDKFLRYNVKPIQKSSGKDGYVLLVENTKKEPGAFHDTILIKTDSKEKPLLRIPVYGRIINSPPSPNGKKAK